MSFKSLQTFVYKPLFLKLSTHTSWFGNIIGSQVIYIFHGIYVQMSFKYLENSIGALHNLKPDMLGFI